MTPKQTIKLLETEFKNKVDIVTSPTFKSKSVEDKIAELAKMYKAGQNIQRMLNDGNGLKPEEIKQYRGRVLTGFKKLKAIMLSISSELSAEEDAVSMVKAKASHPVSESTSGFVKSYKVEKLDSDGNAIKTFIRDFSDMDANSVNSSLNPDGEMALEFAQRKIDILSGEATRKKLNFVYSLVKPISESTSGFVKSYKVEHTGPDGTTNEYIQNFTQIQADSVHAFVDNKGIPTIYAKKLVDEWNRINKAQKSNYKYTLV